MSLQPMPPGPVAETGQPEAGSGVDSPCAGHFFGVGATAAKGTSLEGTPNRKPRCMSRQRRAGPWGDPKTVITCGTYETEVGFYLGVEGGQTQAEERGWEEKNHATPHTPLTAHQLQPWAGSPDQRTVGWLGTSHGRGRAASHGLPGRPGTGWAHGAVQKQPPW